MRRYSPKQPPGRGDDLKGIILHLAAELSAVLVLGVVIAGLAWLMLLLI